MNVTFRKTLFTTTSKNIIIIIISLASPSCQRDSLHQNFMLIVSIAAQTDYKQTVLRQIIHVINNSFNNTVDYVIHHSYIYVG